MLTVIPGEGSGHEGGNDSSPSLIDEIVREGARRMLAEALQAEVDAYIAAHAAEREENDRRLVVRNGYHQPREILTSAGAVEVTVPRFNDKRTDPATGERKRFSSAILPPWARKTPKITEVLPLLYLHGLSSGDFVPALGQFPGSSAGLSAAVITRLTETWKAKQRAFAARDLPGVDYVYLWADGIHVNIRLEEHKLCLLVMIGVRADGARSSSRWLTATGSPRSRGRTCSAIAPAAGCALRCWPWATGHWASGTGCARCSRRPGRAAAGSTRPPMSWLPCPRPRTRARRRPWRRSGAAEDKDHACAAVKTFEAYGAKFPKAAAKITGDMDELLAFFDYPAGGTGCTCARPTRSSPPSPPSATPPRSPRAPGSRAAGLAMAFKLIEAAQDRWRAVSAPHLVAQARAGATFSGGRLIERPGEAAA